ARGRRALILRAFLLIVPWLFFVWYERTGGTLALAGYLAMSAWIVVGFGAIKGLWGIALPIFAGTFLSWTASAYAKPVFGPFWFEITGVAMFIASVFVLYYGVEMLPTRRRRWIAVGADIASAFTPPAFAAANRDTWTSPAPGVVRIGVIVP